jgi:hypothetical protein
MVASLATASGVASVHPDHHPPVTAAGLLDLPALTPAD